MSFVRIKISILMIIRMLIRQKIVLVLIFLIPFLFFSIVELTTAENELPVTVLGPEDSEVIMIPEREISLIYYAIASCGFLVSFLALFLIQQNRLVNKRLVLCGYRSTELLLAILATLVFIIVIISTYVGSLSLLFHNFSNLSGLISGLTTIGFVYGCYGLFVGSFLKRELEGILMIVLLTNIDVGWLQNPVFYSQSDNQDFIELLPGFYPSQSTVLQVFTEYSPQVANINSLIYGLIFFLASFLLFYFRMKIYK